MKLIIVESPAKCATIKRYVGEDYTVMASLGHIRDLATTGKGGLGVDVENEFKPTYVITDDKIKTVKGLLSVAKQADEVILATDPDREGEAIAWHLATVLKLPIESTKRLEFHEITRDSITKAISSPRTIDVNLVSSQETRRIVDRLIGFKLSSLIYKKIHSRSAGRVQSATLNILAEYEKEISSFVPEEYYTFNVKADYKGHKYDLTIKLDKKKVSSEDVAKAIVDSIPSNLKVTSIKKTIRTKESKEPFTTSTLQQAAFNKYKYKTKQTQYIAQTLYEGLNIGEEHVGLITYMRTDSARLSPTYITRAQNYIIERFGKEYVGKVKRGKENEMAQDAHEAIRPTSNHRTPESVKPYLNKNQYNLYKLIYERAISSLMAPKKDEVTTIVLEGNGIKFTLEGEHNLFAGFEIFYKEEKEEKVNSLPVINEGEEFNVVGKEYEQKFTTPPARFSEAKLVKKMEEVGIGRPSTYASTISILYKRKYIKENEDGLLETTEHGLKTATVLRKYFPNIVSASYTAKMEEQLDSIQNGKNHIEVLNDFYQPFLKDLENGNKAIYRDDPVETGEVCPKCGSPLIHKEGKNGKFIGCSNFPKCNYVQKAPKKELVYTGEMCPNCGKPLVERTDKSGNLYHACVGYPSCKYIKPINNQKQTRKRKYSGK